MFGNKVLIHAHHFLLPHSWRYCFSAWCRAATLSAYSAAKFALYRGRGYYHILGSRADVHFTYLSTRKNEHVFRIAAFYEHERMENILHFKWCQLRQRPAQGSLANLHAKSLLHGACLVDAAERDPLVNERLEIHTLDTLVFLAVSWHCNGRE